MASRGVASVPVFYVSESGVAYQLADDSITSHSEKVDHDVEESRVRLANILRNRRELQQQQKQTQTQKNRETGDTQQVPDNYNVGDTVENDDDGEWEDVNSDDDETDVVVRPVAPCTTTELALRRLDFQRQQRYANSLVDREQQLRQNKLLARGSRFAKTNANSTKSIASQFHYKEKPADNAAARAVVHHTSSHYHMAGGVQFQRGVRVKGVVSRHSKQGAKIQAARMSQRNMFAAREDARGERSEGVRSQGKSNTSKKKKQSKKNQDAS